MGLAPHVMLSCSGQSSTATFAPSEVVDAQEQRRAQVMRQKPWISNSALHAGMSNLMSGAYMGILSSSDHPWGPGLLVPLDP